MSIFNFKLSLEKSQIQKGFLLFETAITISVIMLLSLYICNWYSRIVLEHTVFNKKIEALNLACNFIESYKASNIFNKNKKINFRIEKDKDLNNFLWLYVSVDNINIKTGLIYEK